MQRKSKWRIVSGGLVGACVGPFVTPAAGLASAYWFVGAVLLGMLGGLLFDLFESGRG